MAGLGPALEKRAGLADRIEKMEKDQIEFSSEIEKLATALDIALAGDLLGAFSAVDARVQSAKTAAAVRAKKVEELERAEKEQRELLEKQTLHQSRKQALLGSLGVSSLDDAANVLKKVKDRSDFQRQAADAAGEICQAVRAETIQAAEQALADVDHSGLEREVAELNARHEDLDKRSQELFSEYSKAKDKVEAIGGDDAVATLEERRRTTLLQIEDGAQRYLRLRIGAAAAEQALRIYQTNTAAR